MCESQPIKWKRMLLLWFVLILAIKEGWLAMCDRNIHDCIDVSIPPHCALDNFAIGKRVHHGGENGLEIPVSFHFYVPEKAIKMAKK